MKVQVDDPTVVPLTGFQREAHHGEFSLARIQRGECDKLGNRIVEILWLSPDYAIYRTKLGVFIHFSDDKIKERAQREAFTAICPELCELRYLTSEMHGTHPHAPVLLKRLFSRNSEDVLGHSLFDHNIAQSLMLLMEGNEPDAKAIASAALDMAITRITNDNTIRYLRATLISALLISSFLGIFYALLPVVADRGFADRGSPFLVACFFGIIGAAFSIMTRVQAFEMKPCQQSNMNYWMALIRVMIGLIGGFAFFLLAASDLGKSFVNTRLLEGWQGAALIGFIGGFAERMVQSVFKRTASDIEGKTGTPVQRARKPKKAGPDADDPAVAPS